MATMTATGYACPNYVSFKGLKNAGYFKTFVLGRR